LKQCGDALYTGFDWAVVVFGCMVQDNLPPFAIFLIVNMLADQVGWLVGVMQLRMCHGLLVVEEDHIAHSKLMCLCGSIDVHLGVFTNP